jgi:hypothetical protein
MNDALDEMLHEHGRHWVAAQPAPPPLDDAMRRATVRRDLRIRTAVAASVVAVAAIAAIPAIRSLTGDKTDHAGGSPAVTLPVSSSAAASTSMAPLPVDPVLRKLTERARSAAIANQDPTATGEAVRTTYNKAERVVLDGDTSSNPPGDTEVWVIQLHGRFTCAGCSVPASTVAAPSGSAIALVINARTFEGYDFTITKEPHNLTELGGAIPLPVSIPAGNETPAEAVGAACAPLEIISTHHLPNGSIEVTWRAQDTVIWAALVAEENGTDRVQECRYQAVPHG